MRDDDKSGLLRSTGKNGEKRNGSDPVGAESGGSPSTERVKGEQDLPPSDTKASVYYMIAMAHANSESLIGLVGVIFGFAFFLMPLLSPGLREILRSIPIAYFIFDETTKLSPTAVIVAMGIVLLASLTQGLASSWGFPGGWNIHQRGGLPTAKKVIEFQLFPASGSEKFVFLLWAALKLFGIFVWAFPFACLAYFMRIGEIK